MTEQMHYCTYLKKLVDPGLCYDMKMIAQEFIKPSALPDIKIDKAELIKCCNTCPHEE